MAEKKCHKCAMMIPKEASICPHCRSKQGLGLLAKALIGFALLMLFVGFFGSRDITPTQPVTTQADTDDYLARVFAQKTVEKALKAPASAKFQDQNEFTVKKSGQNVYSISGYVDSQNSYGAMIRSRFRVDAVKNKDDWQLADFKFSE